MSENMTYVLALNSGAFKKTGMPKWLTSRQLYHCETYKNIHQHDRVSSVKEEY